MSPIIGLSLQKPWLILMYLDKFLKVLRIILSFTHLYVPLVSIINKIKLRLLPKDRHISFVVYLSSVWKCDGVYKELSQIDGITTSITILPIFDNGKFLKKEYEETIKFFNEKGFNLNIIEPESSLIKSVRQISHIDTIIFCDCWNLSNSYLYYYMLFFKDCVYVPYSHQVSRYGNYQAQYNQLLHNFVRSIYAPHSYEASIFRKFSHVGDKNIKFFGYPGVVNFIRACESNDLSKEIFRNNPWDSFLLKDSKRVIWAPHHSIDWKDRRYSNFFEMHEYMISAAEKYKDEINFIFKPHPMLRQALYRSSWGIKKTDDYYDLWNSMENTKIEEGAYEELFFYSDALIHDSGSFIAEYSYLNKYHVFVLSSEDIIDSFNEFGQLCLKNAINIRSVEGVERFLTELVHDSDAISEYTSKDFVIELRNSSRNACELITKDLLSRKEKHV